VERKLEMTTAWDYPRALEELWNRSSYERGLISDPFGDVERARKGLTRMRACLEALGNPHLTIPTVHVAGSKGKGSTAAFIATSATSAGHRTGLYSSPHLHRFPERIAIDGVPLPDRDFARLAEVVAAAAVIIEARNPELGQVTTFEFITAMAFTAFARMNCALAVIEVGLGGLFDATNVLMPVVTAITRIDLEHTAVLGPTHADIAAQKAGIMHPGVPCMSSPQVAEAASVIEREAATIGAPLLVGGRDWQWQGTWREFTATGPWGVWEKLSLAVPGPHQVENACTAIAALHAVNTAGIAISETAVRAGLARTRWPGRFERVTSGGRQVVFDGAHTPASAAALVATWQSELGTSEATVVLGMGADKNLHEFLEVLRPIIGRLIVTRAGSPRAADPLDIAAAAVALGIEVELAPTVAAAVEASDRSGPAPLLITGSLFVAGEGREALGLGEPDSEWTRLNLARTPRTDAPKPV
jgi:dihydrofolate synthase / folylpolyglutamate synthase